MDHSITRRRFLKTGAAAGAVGACCFISARALGMAGFLAPAKCLTLGVIGLGIQGTGDMRAFLGNPEVQVVAVCDVRKASPANGRPRARDHVPGNGGMGACGSPAIGRPSRLVARDQDWGQRSADK